MELNYRATKIYLKNLLAIEMQRTQILMNKAVYFVLSILKMSKAVRYEF